MGLLDWGLTDEKLLCGRDRSIELVILEPTLPPSAREVDSGGGGGGGGGGGAEAFDVTCNWLFGDLSLDISGGGGGCENFTLCGT